MTTVDAERQFDADLIGRIGTGDEEAFAELYDRFSPGLFSMVMKMTGDEAETEDVLQDAFSHIWRKAASYDGNRSAPFTWAAPAPPLDRFGTARRYLALGFTHIVPGGLDHVLFVLGIYLLSGRVRAVLWQVSAFTLAHSITLGLGLYGIVSVPPRIVEPLIALSIAYVAIENIFLSELRPWRVALVFAFGLLHGLGFAGALQELGLPRAELATALVAFNAGVEAGQLAVIGAAFVLVGGACAHQAWYRQRVVVPASVAIACTAIYWTIARVTL